MEMQVACKGELRNKYKTVVRKAEKTRPFGRYRHQWGMNNIKICLKEAGCENVRWIDVIQNRNKYQAFVSSVLNLRVP